MRRIFTHAVLLPICLSALGVRPCAARQEVLLRDDFERGLGAWRAIGPAGSVSVLTSGDPAHGAVLRLRPDGDVLALLRGSEAWGSVRIEGDVLFPTDEDNYLAVVYSVRETGGRFDFGGIYIKGNESYLRVNPHRDMNVGRALYEEYFTPLGGNAAIRTGEWQRFAAEISGRTCHFYVGDMTTPQLTFDLFELDSGAVGLQPRSVGGDVWVDNVTVTRIDGLSWRGPGRPAPAYAPADLLTVWEVAGPFERTHDALARGADPGAWRTQTTDARGAVITGAIVDYHGPRAVGYFRTRVTAERAGRAVLHLSSVDDVALWVNARFHWFIPRRGLAWHDFARNPEHAGVRIPVDLVEGENTLVLRVRGGVYASGGFFARLER